MLTPAPLHQATGHLVEDTGGMSYHTKDAWGDMSLLEGGSATAVDEVSHTMHVYLLLYEVSLDLLVMEGAQSLLQ